MPEISRFFGIVISMYYDEHNPPHFHARYNEYHGVLNIASLQIMEGKLPPRALGLVVEWATRHQAELMVNWDAARASAPLHKIAPLE